jgi:hypothetical protein
MLVAGLDSPRLQALIAAQQPIPTVDVHAFDAEFTAASAELHRLLEGPPPEAGAVRGDRR